MKTIAKLTCVTLSLALLVSPIAFGAAAQKTKDSKFNKETRNPLGCRDVGYQFELKTLHLLPKAVGNIQSLYFIYNTLGKDVNLYQMRSDESSRSLYMNHVIRAGHWAVLSTTEHEVKFICTIPDSKQRYGTVVDCADSVRVCEYANVKYGLNNRGNFWVVNSNTRDAAVKDVLRYGIIPR